MLKCKVMHVGGQNTRRSYFIEGNRLTVDETEKDLGIRISCSNQCLYAFNNASKVTGVIQKTIKTSIRRQG